MRNLWRRLVCRVLFHELRVVHRCTVDSAKLVCDRCGRYFGINYSVRVFLDWTPDLCICRTIEQITREMMAR